jgi:predicted HTH domain antitoxin
MAELTIQYPDDLLVASGKPRKTVEDELRVVLAMKLFELGQFSLGKAAELAQ